MKWSIAALALISLIGFTASHAFVNNNDKEENGEDRIIVKIIKIENGDTTIIERHYDDLSRFRKLKHHLYGHGKGKSGLHFRAGHSKTDENKDIDIDVKIKIIDYDSDSSSSIHKKIIICFNEDTLEHEDIHINLRDIHREIAKALGDLDMDIMHGNNLKNGIYNFMKEFHMNFDVHTENLDKQIEIIINSLPDNNELDEFMKDIQMDATAI